MRGMFKIMPWIPFLCVPFLCCLAAPRAVWEATRVEAGTLDGEEEKRFAVNVHNAGDEALLLRVEEPCCGMLVELPRAVEAGASGTLVFVFQMKGPAGRLSRVARVLTNDPAQPEVLMRLEGMVLVNGEEEARENAARDNGACGLRVLPARVVLDAEGNGVVMLRAVDQKGFEVVSTALSGAAGRVDARRVTAALWRVGLAGVRLGVQKEGRLAIETTHPDGRAIRVILD